MNHAQKKQLRDAAIRDVAAYLLDRADQYDTDSGCWVALTDAAHNLMNGEVDAALNNGDLDKGLYRRVDSWRGPSKPVDPSSGKMEES